MCAVGHWIAAAKAHITGIARRVTEEMDRKYGRAARIRFAFVGYRDHCDGRQRSVFRDFDTNVDALCEFVHGQRAFGGGDAPEDIAGAYREVLRLSWQSRARFMVHVGDAPCHGRRYHSLKDDHPDGDPNGSAPEALLQDMRSKNIHVLITAMNKDMDKMLRVFAVGCPFGMVARFQLRVLIWLVRFVTQAAYDNDKMGFKLALLGVRQRACVVP